MHNIREIPVAYTDEYRIQFETEWNKACSNFGKHHKPIFEKRRAKQRILSVFEEELLIAMYNENIPYKEIGDRLGVGFELVANRIQRMLKSGRIVKRSGK